MAKKKTTVSTYDLIINQGDDFLFQIVIKDNIGNPIDITGNTYECKVRETAEDDNAVLVSECKILEATEGLIEIHFRNEDTSNIDTNGDTYEDVSKYTYDVIQTTLAGKRTRILQGMIYVSPGVSFH